MHDLTWALFAHCREFSYNETPFHLRFGYLEGCGGKRWRAHVETEAPRAERDNLQKAAGHGDVLEEMHKLVLVGDIGVKQNSGGDGVRSQHRGSEARAITQDQRDAAS